MFGELPKLFERHFAIGFLLPSVLFVAASTLIFNNFTVWNNIQVILTGNSLYDATLAIVLAWMIGIFLLVINRDLYRFLEGYGSYNPIKILTRFQVREFTKKQGEIKTMRLTYRKTHDDALMDKLQLMVNELAQKYPPEGYSLLPTPFGNAIQAFEIYPNHMYGIEGIDGWARIQAVMPIEYRILVDDAKAQVDWWVNISAISFFLLIEFYVVCFYEWGVTAGVLNTVLNIIVPMFLFITINYFIQWRAVSAVIGWGDYIKSSFDLYRYQLLDLMGIDMPENREKERKLWIQISQAVVYHKPEVLPPIKFKK